MACHRLRYVNLAFKSIYPSFGAAGRRAGGVMHLRGPASVLASLGRGCYAASGATVTSIGEKWYYFRATSDLEGS